MACKEYSFLCNNGKCILGILKCNNFNDCGDNSDEPDSCHPSFQDSEKFAGKFFGGFFGAAAGVLFFIIGIIIIVIITILICICNKKCSKQHRRDQPPVIVVEPHEDYTRDNVSLINVDD